MNPKADAEKIRFRNEADSCYRLVHEGTLDGSSNLSYIVRLAEGEMGIKLERKGYFGQGRYSSQTLQSDRPINTRVFGWKCRRLLALPLEELATVLRTRHLLGPKAGEPEFEGLDERTSALVLKTWSLDYYEANGLNCPGSLAALDTVIAVERPFHVHADAAPRVCRKGKRDLRESVNDTNLHQLFSRSGFFRCGFPTAAMAFLMMLGRSAPTPSARRRINSTLGLRSPRSTRPTMDSDTPERWATAYFESP
jgi:hypothetical protein